MLKKKKVHYIRILGYKNIFALLIWRMLNLHTLITVQIWNIGFSLQLNTEV